MKKASGKIFAVMLVSVLLFMFCGFTVSVNAGGIFGFDSGDHGRRSCRRTDSDRRNSTCSLTQEKTRLKTIG